MSLPLSSRYEDVARRCAPDGAAPDARRRSIDDWCYLPSWIAAPLAIAPVEIDDGAAWVVLGDFGLGDAICRALRERVRTVVGVRAGHRYERRSETSAALSLTEAADYRSLLRDVSGDGRRVRIIHLWHLRASGDFVESYEQAQPRGLASLIALARAASAEAVDTDVLVVTNYVEQVSGGERVFPERRSVRAAAVVIPHEFEHVRCRLVDVGPIAGRETEAARQIRYQHLVRKVLDECQGPRDPIVAYRGDRRWIPCHSRLTLPSAGQSWLRRDGVYLLVGGSGTIGAALTERMSGVRCRLTLVGRRGERATDGALDAAVAAARAAGSEVAVHRANTAQFAEMEAIALAIERRWGHIDGVFHLTGLNGVDAPVAVVDVTPERMQPHVDASVHGTQVLQRLFAPRTPDFVVTFSSTAAWLGGAGLLPWAAANAFLDGVAMSPYERVPTRWISINWDGWIPRGDASCHERTSRLDRYAIDAGDAFTVLDRIMSSALSGQVIVSVADLDRRMRVGD